ncbi:hypothetical protein KSD_08360 [Ktedonobacter sp. SOSP1-85]|uniref:ArnT family glycosyltransferase n=1 Tax=Ktedonobacter sp. SOSP1-85 TaxID=2778367 RepID=UPI0019151262|nr:glycosyltransferase family 39 protein [Ktedonobacter sp. SOSP1-85]GHO73065.1 hypothetical protein KSD_08360 [Ktedonobacter sp. SOSP1-85]
MIKQLTERQKESTIQSGTTSRFRLTRPAIIDICVVLVLLIVALIPRIQLANQLDMVTDEIVYIWGGKVYFPLLTHLQFTSPAWHYNYEHPPLVKLLIGFTLACNSRLGHPLTTLQAGRVPSIVMGVLLIAAIYWLGRRPFGRTVATLAALCLAVSPWLAYFSALAYLDMTMTALATIAFLLLWYAVQRPWMYLLVGVFLGLAADSKYPAVFLVPGMVLYALYYTFFIHPRLGEASKLPWKWWLGAMLLSPLVFLLVDPAIWTNPPVKLFQSFFFEWNHSSNGHLTFMAGAAYEHMPRWTIFYMLGAKLSVFLTLPALGFIVYAVVKLVRYHRTPNTVTPMEAASVVFLSIWLVSAIAMYGLLNIVVGTHYYLPVVPPIALSGAFGLAVLLRYRRSLPWKQQSSQAVAIDGTPLDEQKISLVRPYTPLNARAGITIALMVLILTIPHLIGLVTIPDAEGYTSELFPNENASLQVAYPGYRDAVLWLADNDKGPARVGLVAISSATLGSGPQDEQSWYYYNQDLPKQLSLSTVTPSDRTYKSDYLVWPMHLQQRGYTIPEPWRSHIVHTVTGGNTIYCYILSR